MSDAKYLHNQLTSFHGATLIDTIVDEAEDDDFLALVLRRADGRVAYAWVMRDPEGNGPGFLDIAE